MPTETAQAIGEFTQNHPYIAMIVIIIVSLSAGYCIFWLRNQLRRVRIVTSNRSIRLEIRKVRTASTHRNLVQRIADRVRKSRLSSRDIETTAYHVNIRYNPEIIKDISHFGNILTLEYHGKVAVDFIIYSDGLPGEYGGRKGILMPLKLTLVAETKINPARYNHMDLREMTIYTDKLTLICVILFEPKYE